MWTAADISGNDDRECARCVPRWRDAMSDVPADRVRIEGLRLWCVVGVNPWERVAEQEVEVDVTLHTDLRVAAGSDDIGDAVDYGTVAEAIAGHVAASRFHLLEALAEGVAEVCLEDSRVSRVDVRIRKPGALGPGVSPSVEITRCKQA